jgi:hypothetical protein
MSGNKPVTLEESEALHREALQDGRYAPVNAPYERGKTKQESDATPPAELGLNDPIDFGKHKGKSIYELIASQRGYMKWVIEKTDRKFSGDVIAKMKREGII